MAIEIEHKFLVTSDAWRAGAVGIPVQQGYLSRAEGRTVRIRLEGTDAWLTIKGQRIGLSNPEFEYQIPWADGVELLGMCPGYIIEKTRYEVMFAGKLWEIDEFHGENTGLIVAEIELAAEGEPFERPDWIGEDVSYDPRYLNSHLSEVPYSQWQSCRAE